MDDELTSVLRRRIHFDRGAERYRLASRRALSAEDLERSASPLELRLLIRQLMDEEPPWRSERLRELCETLGMGGFLRPTSEARRRVLLDELLRRLTSVGSPLVLLREPPPLFERRSAGESELEDTPFEARDEDTEWIEIQLVDKENNPVPNVRYRIELPDHRVRTGRTNANGVIRYDRIRGGTCKFTFPDLDEEAWEPA